MTPDLLTPGTTWTPTRPARHAKPRTLVWAGETPSILNLHLDGNTVGYRNTPDPSRAHWPETRHDTWVFIGTWRAWVRKHAAVAVDAGVPSEPPPNAPRAASAGDER